MFFKEQLLSSSQYNVQKTSNKLFAWGLGTSGQTGTELYLFSLAQLSSGLSHTIALTSNNRLLIWGLNSSGQLGDGTTVNKSFPIQIGGTGWKKVSAGSSHTVAVRADGSLFSWGSNASGQVGDNTTINKSSPVQIGTGVVWDDVDAGQDYAIALNNAATLYGWGLNSSGQIGDNTSVSKSNPVQVFPNYFDATTLSTVTAGVSSVSTTVIPVAGTFSAPMNLNRPVGVANTVQQITTTARAAFALSSYTNYTIETWVYITNFNNGLAVIYTIGQVNSGVYQFLAVDSASTISFGWGVGNWNFTGSFSGSSGIGVNSWYHVALVKQSTLYTIYVNGLVKASQTVAATIGAAQTMYFGSYFGDQGANAWSLNGYISNFRMVSGTAVYTGPFTPPTTPLTIIAGTEFLLDYTIPSIPPFNQISAGNNASYGIDFDGLLYAWGNNSIGQLGNSGTLNRSAPIQIGTSSWNVVSGGVSHAIAIRLDGGLFVWGLNNVGQLGNGTINRSSPVQLGSASWKQISAGNSFSLAIGSNNLLYAWGLNSSGQLGDGTINRSAPLQITAGSWTLISAGGLFATATNDNKLLYNWGSGAGGTQADGTTINRSSPVLVSFSQAISQSSPVQIGAESWTYVASGNNFFIALRSDSLLYSWGNNADGQLGINNTINRSSPVLIGTSSWIAVSATGGSAGINQVIAIRSDRTLWGWGINANGMLPTGLQSNSWRSIANSVNHTIAVRNDGTLWAWGQNNVGQLGLTNTINRSSPVQLGVNTNWSRVAAGQSHSLASTTTLELYAWGLNNVGQLGLNDTINRSSPVQVTGSYRNIDAATSHSVAIDDLYRVYAWGNNVNGQVGDNSTINRSTPTLLASPFNTPSWSQVQAGANITGAVNATTQQVYMWGWGDSGRLGTGTTLSRSNPTIIGGVPLQVLDVSSYVNVITQTNTNFTTTSPPVTTAVSGTFNGVTSYLNIPSAAVFTMPLAFTMECWFRQDIGATGGQVILALGNNLNSNNPVTFSVDGSSVFATTYASGFVQQQRSTAYSQGVWYHIAFTKFDNGGGTYLQRFFVNGVQIGSNMGGGASVGSSTGDVSIGNWHLQNSSSTRTNYFQGAISNTRIVKGIDVYTGNFIIPSAVLTVTQSAGTNIRAIGAGETSLLTYTTQAATIVGGAQVYGNLLSLGTAQGFVIDPVGGLYAWGQGTNGALGLGTDVFNRSAPQQIGSSSWTYVSADKENALGGMATDAQGRLFAWGGLTASNLLGDATTVTRSSPVQVTNWAVNRLQSIGIAGTTIGIIRDDSLLYFWGPNLNGQVGDGTTIYKSTPTQIGPAVTATSSPVQIGSLSSWNSVSLGFSTAAAIDTLGRLYLWGSDNQFGTLGSSSTIKRLVPTTPIDSSSWTQVSSGNYHVLAVTTDNRMFAWGRNQFYQIGDNTSVNKSSPTQIGTPNSWLSVSAGNNHSLGIRSDYLLFAWGNNNAGQLGIVTVPSLWTQVSVSQSATFAIRADGLLYAWGLNSSGQLGDGTTLDKSSPTQIGTSSWTLISNNFSNSAAIRSDGKLFTWGAGNFLIGDGTTIAKSSPVQIGTSSWIQVSVGYSHALAIDAQGRLYGWGLATALNASTANFSWTMVTENGSRSLGIRSDGLLYAWGSNTGGQYGDGTTVTQSSPVQIGTSSWIFVSTGTDHTLGVTVNNRLFAWGINDRFQLGDNTTINKSSPVQIGSNLSWTKVAAGNKHSMAITNNNELYAWGLGSGGQLGTLTQPQSWSVIHAGYSTSSAVEGDGSLFLWGLNSSGQVGDSTTISKSSPTQVPVQPAFAPASWLTVSSGLDHSLGITSTGALYGWGNPVTGATGNYGELYSWNMVAASGDNWYGIRSDGSLWVTGSNTRGSLGLNDTVARSSPVQVGSSSYIFVNAGGTTNFVSVMAITTDNRLFGWGYNEVGSLGLNDIINRSSPTQIDAGNIYSYAAPGVASFMIRTNGTLYATGFDSAEGRLGLGVTNTSRSNPTQIGTSTWSVVSFGQDHALAIRSDNTLWAWGRGTENQLGNGTAVNRSSPTQVTSPGNAPWIAIAAGGAFYSVGVTGLGLGTPYSVYVWGANNSQGSTGLNATVGNNALPTLMKAGAAGNSFIQVATNPSAGSSQPNTYLLSSNGQLWSAGWLSNNGDNTAVSRSSPVLVFGSTSWSQLPKIVGDQNPIAIATNGTLWAWSSMNNMTYVPGAGLQSSPVQVGGNIRWASYTFPLYDINSAGSGSWTAVEAAQSFSLGIRNNRLYGWGFGGGGQLGIGNNANWLSPTQASSTISWNSISASLGSNFAGGISSDNKLYMWGTGNIEVLPVRDNTDTWSWTQISLNYFQVIAIRSDGTLWSWGENSFGQLGLGDTINRSSPVQIGTSSWIFAHAGYVQSAAIRDDGTLWTWGRNYFGSLGDNTGVSKSSPVQVFGGGSWAQVASGTFSYIGLRSDGLIFAWGEGAGGELGQGALIQNRSIPLQIGTSSWSQIGFAERTVVALRIDSTLWMWGNNGAGQLGQGDTIARSSPIQVAGNWRKFSIGGDINSGSVSMLAIRQDGTGNLWAWGQAGNGQLGNLSIVNRSSPVLVGNNAWTDISNGGLSAFGIDANGILYAWGRNNNGELGLNNVVNRSSPTVVPGSWKALVNRNMALALSGAIDANNNFYIWGRNDFGQIGDGTTSGNKSSPVQVAGNWTRTLQLYSAYPYLQFSLATSFSTPVQVGNSSWTQLSSGTSHALAIRADGTLWAWGNNTNYQLGLGITDTITRSSPTQIGTSSWISAGAGFDHSIAVRNDGTLWGWGNNAFGQVGLITNTFSWTQLAFTDSHRLAIRSDGLLYAWGTNTTGQLGDNTTINRSSPIQIGTSSWTFISAGNNFSIAVDNIGKLYAWGQNNVFQLGDGTTVNKSNPVLIGTQSWSQINAGFDHSVGIDSTNSLNVWGNSLAILINPITYSWSQIKTSIGNSFSAAIRSDGKLFTWGNNLVNGNLGDTTTVPKSSPVIIGNASWSQISLGTNHMAALRTDGTLWVWGSNQSGQLGNNSTLDRSSPIQVGSQSNWALISAGDAHTFAIDTDSKLYAWGFASTGQLGDNSTVSKSSPVQIGTSSWIAISAGSGFTLALANNNLLYAWGRNDTNQLGDGTSTNKSSPIQIGSNSWSKISAGTDHSLAIDTTSKLYAWGNPNAVLLQINTGPKTNSWSQVKTSVFLSFSAAIRSDGMLFTWGSNLVHGNLGDISTVPKSSPVIIGQNSWSQIAVGGSHMAAIRADGTLWTWGGNSAGALGINSTLDRSSPTQLGTASNWSQIAAGDNYTLALDNTNLLYAWGTNNFGQLGDNSTINKSSPVQIGSSSWTSVSGGGFATYAIRLDGGLFTWGLNSSGQLGDNTTINKSSPIQIGSSSWTIVSSGFEHGLALRVGGSLFSWGNNNFGQLGDNTTINKSSPVIIGSSSFTSVSAGNSNSQAIDSVGRMFAWGLNTSSQLGDATAINKSSPVLIASGSSFIFVARGKINGFAIRSDNLMFGWGAGGTTGDNSITNFSTPNLISPLAGTFTGMQIPTFVATTIASWSQVAAGNSTSQALDSINRLYAWGINSSFQLGLGDGVARSSPTQLTTGSFSYTQITQGRLNGFAIRDNGLLYGWGSGPFVGDNTISNYNAPTLITTTIGFGGVGNTPTKIGASSWTQVTAGRSFTGAIRADGLLFAWGLNNVGQVGVNDLVTRSSPVITTTISGQSSYTAVSAGWSHSVGITIVGTLLFTGLNTSGQLGDNTTVNKQFYTLMGGGNTGWTRVVAGEAHTLAIQNNILYVWGNNAFGQLGLGNNINRSSPVVLNAFNTFPQITACGNTSGYITNNNILFTWGASIIGDGSTVNKSSPIQIGSNADINTLSPVQIGSSSNWSQVSAGYQYTIAKDTNGNLYSWGQDTSGQLGL